MRLEPSAPAVVVGLTGGERPGWRASGPFGLVVRACVEGENKSGLVPELRYEPMTAEDGSKHWYVARDGKQTGPISEAEFRAIAAHGYFRPTDLVWRPGMAEWQPAPTVIQAAPPVGPPPAPAPASAAHTGPQSQTSQFSPQQASHGQPVAYPAQTDSRAGETHPQASSHFPASPQAHGHPSYGEANRPANNGYPVGAHPAGAVPPTGGRPAPAPPYATRGPGPAPSQGHSGGHPAGQLGQVPNGAASAATNRQLAPLSASRELERSQAASPTAPGRRSGRMAMAALVITLVAIAGGVYVAAEPQLTKSGALEPVRRAVSSMMSNVRLGSTPQTADFEASLQATAHWPVIKREFPDWYGERLREAAKLTAENKSPDDITKVLAERIVALRRQNAPQALAASPQKLLAVANAFLANLRQLKQSSPQTCYNFISQGEMTPAVLGKLKDPASPAPGIQLQVAAIFEAIGEGRRTPVTYEKPQKADYDTLMSELGKLGWTQDDVATFANPRSLARTEPARVCQMVQDWFVAHIGIADDNTRQRLIGETLRPVVSG